jgi:hypothetical protein
MDFLKNRKFLVAFGIVVAGVGYLLTKKNSPSLTDPTPNTKTQVEMVSTSENPKAPINTEPKPSIEPKSANQKIEYLDPQNPKYQEGVTAYLSKLPADLKKRARLKINQRAVNKIWAYLEIDEARIYLSEARFLEDAAGKIKLERGQAPDLGLNLPPFPKTNVESFFPSIKSEIEGQGFKILSLSSKQKIWEKTSSAGLQPRHEISAKIQSLQGATPQSELIWINAQTGKIEKRIKAVRK